MARTYPARSLLALRRTEEDPLAFLEELARTNRDVVPFRLGRRYAFLVNDPARAEEVLARHSSTFVKGRGFARAARLLGNGLLTADEALHARRRRLTQPAFHMQRVHHAAATVIEQAIRLQDGWRDGQVVDVGQQMRRLTLAITGEAFFGADLGDCAEAIADAVAVATPRMDGLLALVAPARQTEKARRVLERIVGDIVERRRRSGRVHVDLLALLLGAEDDPASTTQLVDDAVTFLLAGHDTIAHALTWTWVLLAQHPEADSRLARTAANVFGAHGATIESLPPLAYAKGVFAESLRLFPPAWVIVRRAAVATTLGRTDIPAGSVVVTSPFVAHRDPKAFAEPLRFLPERWLATPPGGGDESFAAPRRSFTYYPFGGGPRSCIGESFAWMEGTLVLATLAQRWRLSGPDGAVSPCARITLRPARPVLMTLHRRDA